MVYPWDIEEHCLPATHYLVRGVSNTWLTGHVEIPIVQQRALLLIRLSASSGRLLRRSLCGGFFRTLQLPQQCLIVLQVCSASMKAQNAQEDILIVRAACHRLDEVDVRVLCTLTAGIIRVGIIRIYYQSWYYQDYQSWYYQLVLSGSVESALHGRVVEEEKVYNELNSEFYSISFHRICLSTGPAGTSAAPITDAKGPDMHRLVAAVKVLGQLQEGWWPCCSDGDDHCPGQARQLGGPR